MRESIRRVITGPVEWRIKWWWKTSAPSPPCHSLLTLVSLRGVPWRIRSFHSLTLRSGAPTLLTSLTPFLAGRIEWGKERSFITSSLTPYTLLPAFSSLRHGVCRGGGKEWEVSKEWAHYPPSVLFSFIIFSPLFLVGTAVATPRCGTTRSGEDEWKD